MSCEAVASGPAAAVRQEPASRPAGPDGEGSPAAASQRLGWRDCRVACLPGFGHAVTSRARSCRTSPRASARTAALPSSTRAWLAVTAAVSMLASPARSGPVGTGQPVEAWSGGWHAQSEPAWPGSPVRSPSGPDVIGGSITSHDLTARSAPRPVGVPDGTMPGAWRSRSWTHQIIVRCPATSSAAFRTHPDL
jgi:hypothetical protein